MIKPSREVTRMLLSLGSQEMMRAALPPPTAAHPRAAATLLDGLSLWFGRPLSVVLSADAKGTSSALGLCDGFGFGSHTLHYEVEVIEAGRHRRGMGSFRDLRQLELKGLR
jgi:hypothetical protein